MFAQIVAYVMFALVVIALGGCVAAGFLIGGDLEASRDAALLSDDTPVPPAAGRPDGMEGSVPSTADAGLALVAR
ncbi:MAG: hypothetical protein LKE37_07385 [Atopobiaceae bacterium]|jgi:hypothetical protein|nr:hypothetical protein [Atopobiaceae bacterium]